VDNYYASEIDTNAIKVTQHNYPNTIQLGDITKIKGIDLPKIDLLIGGSPCQGFSFAGKQLNFEDPRSKLFFEYARLLKEIQPKYFLLENVKMKKEYQDVISEHLGVEPIKINSALVSAQKRERLYWTNIPNITQPEDKGIVLKDIIEEGVEYDYVHSEVYKNGYKRGISWQYDVSGKGYNSQSSRAYFLDGKCSCLSTSGHCIKILTPEGVRLTTRNEHERLQTVPDNYTIPITKNKAKSALGNGWTVDIITHIFNFMMKNED